MCHPLEPRAAVWPLALLAALAAGVPGAGSSQTLTYQLSPPGAARRNAPPFPVLGPVTRGGALGGTLRSALPAGREPADPATAVETTGKLQESPPVGPAGPTGGMLPSAVPGWQPAR